jgi:hypothetical protein
MSVCLHGLDFCFCWDCDFDSCLDHYECREVVAISRMTLNAISVKASGEKNEDDRPRVKVLYEPM